MRSIGNRVFVGVDSTALRTEHDLEISNHPMYASRVYTIALLGMRMRIMF